MPVLAKTLILSTDDAPQLDRDLEGMAVLLRHELLLVNDNVSVEGARTRFCASGSTFSAAPAPHSSGLRLRS